METLQMTIQLAKTRNAELIRRFLLNAIKAGDSEYMAHATETYGISRQAVHRHLAALVEIGFLKASGHTKGRIYSLGDVRSHKKQLALKGLKESDVYLREFGFVFSGLPRELDHICHYGFTEILNNAIDHSCGKFTNLTVDRTSETIRITIEDDGEGIFKHIARIMELSDPRESILELSKGKLTTDPANHSGQGIFFSSRAFDKFMIVSGDLVFSHHDGNYQDVLWHNSTEHKGTVVHMELSLTSTRTLRQVFDEFTDTNADEIPLFNKTIVPVRLALYEGEQLISRSQAKRILNRIEKFKTVVLDFEGVSIIGQGFADEVFRVFVNHNPQIQLTAINYNTDIKKTIEAAKQSV
jgi:anti-sigma regulatory factor (Ser/Thr protein kinase)